MRRKGECQKAFGQTNIKSCEKKAGGSPVRFADENDKKRTTTTMTQGCHPAPIQNTRREKNKPFRGPTPLTQICQGHIWFMHFKIVCTTWGLASRFQRPQIRNTRTREQPLGDRTRARWRSPSRDGCSLMPNIDSSWDILVLRIHVVCVCVWLHLDMAGMIEKCEAFMATYDQCHFGLQLPGDKKHQFCRRRPTFNSCNDNS